MTEATVELLEMASSARGEQVGLSVLLPPGFDRSRSLPLIINLHGGGSDRYALSLAKDLYADMFADGTLDPCVVVSFTSGPYSFYAGMWESFVADDLPQEMHTRFNTSLDPKKTALTGVSMGGFGSLKIGFKNPNRFAAIAAMEPGILPSLNYEEALTTANFWTRGSLDELVWGSPVDVDAWEADNPASIAKKNAKEISEGLVAIRVECGDNDLLNLHWGAEFLHRVLWDHGIQHEYQLVRWGDHLGLSLVRRLRDSHAFIAKVFRGEAEEPRNLPLNDAERRYLAWAATGGTEGENDTGVQLQGFDERAPSLLAAMFGDRLQAVGIDPSKPMSYAKLPSTE